VYYYSQKLQLEESITKKYNIPVPDKFQNTDEPLRVSIGILNTQNLIDTRTHFKCFKVSTISTNPTVSLIKEDKRQITKRSRSVVLIK